MTESFCVARGFIKQRLSTLSTSGWLYANFPLFTASVQTCCPIQTLCVKRPSCFFFSGHPATSQVKRSSPPTHSQNVKLSSPQGDVLECLSESMIAAQVERTKGKLPQSSERRTDRLVLFIYYWFIPAAILSEVLEFQLFPTLFCKSYYPPLISCSVLYIVQSVSAHFSVIALHEEFFPPGRVKTQQRREFQPVVVR